MKIIIAPDSFKESMTALEAASAIEKGFLKIYSDATYIKIPMADGGEGTVQSVVDATGGEIKRCEVTGPLFQPVEAFYGLSGDKKLAVIEMAASSGLELLEEEERNPLTTTTLGFGELIVDALEEGVDELLLGLGGSATNDGGAGMFVALGGKLLDSKDNPIEPTGKGLADLSKIELANLHPRLKDVVIKVATDVDNPLTGEKGAAYIYGPQKGGSEEEIKLLDQNLEHFAKVVKEQLNKDIKSVPGAGAAGGLGAGLLAFMDAELEQGGPLLTDLLNLEKEVRDADLVLTGEGNMNEQTIFGKTPVAVAQVAKRYDVPVIALVGSLSDGYQSVFDKGIDAVFSIIPSNAELEKLLEDGPKNLEETAQNVARLLKM